MIVAMASAGVEVLEWINIYCHSYMVVNLTGLDFKPLLDLVSSPLFEYIEYIFGCFSSFELTANRC